MKLIKLLMLFLVSAFAISSATGQANAYLNILTQNGGQVALGGTVNIELTVGNTGPTSPIGVNKVRAQISVPSAIVSILPNAQQTGLPPGWTITVNTGSAITVCNGSDPIAVGSARTILIKVQGNALGGPSTVNGNLLFSSGTSCTLPGSLPGDNTADNSSTTSIQVINAPACNLAVSASAGTIGCFGGTATLTATATGASGSVEYSLNGGAFQAGNTFTVTAAGSPYTVVAREVSNPSCTATSNVVTVTQPAQLVASESHTAVLCFGGSSTVTISATGGTTPYTGTGTFTQAAGTQSYTVTDANGCTSIVSVTVTEPTQLSATASSTPVSVTGGNDGTATANPSGGTSPYTYLWSPGGQTTQTATGLTVGSYTVTVTDANGCIATATTVVAGPACNIAVTASAGTIGCFGGSTTLTATATGANGSTEYSLNGGAFQAANTFTVNAAGSPYTVVAREVSNPSCTATSNVVTVIEPIQLVATESHTAILCFGGSSTVTVSATGGTAPYTGTGTFSRTAGTYSFTVTDANGCISSVSVTVSEPSAITASATSGTILCNGGTTTLTVTASGGTAPYQYSLNGGPPFQTANTFTIGAGNFTVTVKDVNNCTTTTGITIGQPSPLVATSTAPPITVVGGTTTVTVSASGGTAPYTGTGTFVRSAGTYSFTVTDANGCTANTSITLTNPSANAYINILTQNGGQVTQGNIVNIEVTVGNTGPTGAIGPNRVRAQISVPIAIVNVLPNAQQTGLPSGWTIVNNTGSAITICNGSDVIPVGAARTILIKVQGNTIGGPSTINGNLLFSNGTSCTLPGSLPGDNTADNSSTTSIEVISGCNIAVTASAGTIGCFGGTTTLTATATGASGSVEYSLNGGAFQAANTFTVTAAGSPYTVVAREVSNPSCSATSAAVTVTEPTQLVASSSATAILCNGGSSTVTVSATGGTAPYTGTGTFSRTAGTYSFTVTDANGCTSVTSVTIAEPTALVASSSATAILCNGGSSTVTVSATGGTAPYTGTGTFSRTAGTYSFTVTDANGCTAVTSVTIAEPTALVASSSATAILCNGGSSTVTVSATGGTAPYTGTGTFVRSAGTYSFTVTDANGCTSVTSVTIAEPAALTATATSTAVTTIGGSDGTATAIPVGGTSPYTYSWAPGGQTTATATGLTAGSYTVTVTDANGCIATATTTVGSPACNVVLSFTQTNVLCFGGATGTATVTAANTTGTVSYSWNTVPVQTTATATGLAAGTYTVTVTDGSNCTASGSVTITQPAAALVATESHTAILCFGGSSTVTVSATGGTSPYTGTGTFSRTAGTYSFTVTDANGCTAVTSVTIAEPTALVASSSATAILCNGGSSTVTVSATGGTAPYTGTGSFSRTAGTYSFTVTDVNGCTAVTSVTIAEPTALVASSSATAILCNGGSSTVTVSATGGTAPYTGTGTFSRTAGTYSFTVTDANGCTAVTSVTIAEPTALVASSSATAILCNGGSSTVTVSATGGTAPYTGTGSFSRTAGTYSFTVTDVNGCTAVTSVTIAEPTALVASSSATAILCNGGSSTVTVSATGGTAPYTGTGTFSRTAGTYSFTVTDANGCTSVTSVTIAEPTALVASSSATAILCNGGSSTVTVSATGGTAPYTGTGTFSRTAGTYSFTVTDANGCTAVTSVTIAEPTALVASSSATAILCNGGSSTVTVSATGGTAPYTGTGTFVRSAGTYSFTVTDANGCTSVTSVTIAEPAALTATATSTAVTTIGGSDGTATAIPTGGISPYTYLWTPGGQTTATAVGLTAGPYTVTVTDANGCIATATTTVGSPACNVVLSFTQTNVLCFGGSTGTATVTAANTSGTVSYLWTPGGQTTATATGLSAGTYTVTVTDGSNCTASGSVTITEPATALVATESHTAILCFGGSSTVTISATGGTVPYTGTGTFTQSAGTQSYTVTDANGCTSIVSVTVAEPAALTATATSTAVTTIGGSDGTATAIPTGGTSPYTYLWTPGGQTTTTAVGLTAGTYTVTVTDANGCIATATTTVGSPACNVTLSFTQTNVLCFGGSTGTATVTAANTSGTVSYLWTPGGQTTATATGLSAGTYTVTVTDGSNCTASGSVTITQPAASLVATESHTSVLCFGGSSIVTISATGGTSPYTGTGTFTQAAGTQSYTVTDANGCISSVSVTVTEPSAITASATAGTILCNGGTTTLTVTASGGTAPYQYSLNGGPPFQTGNTFTVGAGNFTVTVKDVNNCTTTTSITIGQPSPLVATSTAPPITVVGGTTTVTVSATGGTAPYTGTGTFVRSAGTYSFTVTDANGCTANTTITLTNPLANAYINILTQNGGQVTQGNIVNVEVTVGNTGPTGGIGPNRVRAQISVPIAIVNVLPNAQQTGLPPGWTIVSNSGSAITICNGSDVIPVGAARTILIKVQGNTIGGPSTINGNLLFSNGTSCTLPGSLPGDNTADNSSTTSIEVISGCNLAVTASAGTIACFGGTTTLTATATGANGSVEYSLNGGAFQAANTFTVNAAGSPYTVVAREVANPTCTATSNAVTVTEPTQLVASSTAGTISCPGGTTTVTVSATGGTTPYTGTGTFTVTAGTYNYTVTDANGCTSVSTITVNPGVDNTNPTITAPAPLTVCTNSGCTATGVNLGTPVTADNCSVASVTNNAPASFPLGSTTVTWTVTDGNGNTATATQVVTVNDCVNPVIYFQGSSLITGITGPTSSQSPYLRPTTAGGKFTSLISVNDLASGYRMVGIPDGLGAFDNNNGTFTLLMNHELQATLGSIRAHGARGAFVSKWIINKSNLAVQSGSDLMQRVFLWNGTGFTQNLAFAFGRFCSADLPPVSAFYNHATGKGTQERIFMNGEETGTEGKGVGHVVTGSEAGDSYDLPYTGKFAWENSVASPFAQDKTIVIGLDDGQNGQVYVYVGTKTNSGIAIDKAGLNNGKLFGVKVTGLVDEVSASVPAPNTPFTLFDHGFVQNTTGAILDASSEANQVTSFLRPEDGAFDPSNPNDFYFLTTNSFTSPSRMWRLRFNNIATPETGGTITAVLDGTEGPKMMDNLGIDKTGHILIQQDPGNQDHNAKIWQYTIATDAIVLVGKHDPARFGDLVGATVTPATAPFNRDEESSGIIDMSDILAPGMFLLADQTHYAPATNTAEVVEGGQLLAFFNPASISTAPLNAAPDTIRSCSGTGVNLGTPATADNCSVASVTNNAPAVFPIGNTTVTWTVTDGSGNTATATQVVIVSDLAVTATSTAVTTVGGSDGTATAVVTGGTAPYTYSWAPGGQTTATATGLTAGTYTVTVTDAAGCIRTATVTVGSPACNVTLSFTQTNVLCFGGATGSATVTAANTTGTVSYSWNTVPVQTTATATGLAEGTYNVTVTDGAGCTASGSVTITEPAALVASSSATAILCNGGSSTVTVSATGGTAPYTGTGTFSRTAGTYSFTVTDANGCTAVTSVTITEPATALVASSSATEILCNGGSSTVTVSATGGTAPYTGTGTFSRTAGTYSFTVTDANGCTAVTSVTITEPATALVATSSATAILCNGGSSTVTVSATGGTAPYSGTGTFSRTAGTYSFTVTDANGCTAVTTITIAQPAVLVASSSATVIACNGGSSTVTVSATGGTAPYTGTGTFSRTAGTYSFTVTDANGCTAVTTITITEPEVLVASSSATAILCNGGSSTVTVSASGGTAPYTGTGTFSRTAGTYTFTVTDARGCTAVTTITIAQPSVLVASSTATVIACNGGSSTVTVSVTGGTAPYTGTGTFSRTAGTYSFIVTDANGCTAVTSITIAQPAVLTVTTSSTAASSGSNGTATANPSGGTAPYTYLWTPGGQTTQTATGLAAGNYTVTVTDSRGCTVTATVTVASDGCSLVVIAGPDKTLCSEASVTLAATVSGVSAGLPAATPFTEVSGSTADMRLFSGNIDQITIGNTFSQSEDRNNCGKIVETSKTLTIPAGAVVKKAYLYWSGSGSLDNTVKLQVPGSGSFTNLTADGTKTATRSGGFNYFAARKDVTSLVTASGTYTVKDLNWSNGSPYCYDNSAYGAWAMTVIYEKGTLPSARIHVNTEKFVFTYPANTYSTTINNVSVPTGCTADAKLTIVAFEGDNYKGEKFRIAGVLDADTNNFRGQSGPNLDIITKNAPSIVGGTTSLTYSIESYQANTIFGPAIEGLFDYVKVLKYNYCPAPVCNVAYQWTKNGTTVGTTQSISVNTAGTYVVRATDCANCVARDTVVVTTSTLAASSTAGTINCNVGTTTVTVSASGGTAPYTGTGTFTRAAGTWSFTVTDATGCTAVTSVTIAQPVCGPVDPNKCYRIVNRKSGKSMSIESCSTGDNKKAEQQTSSNCLVWKFVEVQPGFYRIINVNSNKSVEVKDASTSNDKEIVQAPYAGADHEKWSITANGAYFVIKAKHSGKAMSVKDGSTSNGADIVQRGTGSNTQEQWSFVEVSCYNSLVETEEGPIITQTEEFDLNVYPNPSNSYFNLTIKSSDKTTPVNVRILDVNGKVITLFPNVQVIKTNSLLRIDAIRLAAGVYFAEVTQGDKRKTVKLIKVN